MGLIEDLLCGFATYKLLQKWEKEEEAQDSSNTYYEVEEVLKMLREAEGLGLVETVDEACSYAAIYLKDTALAESLIGNKMFKSIDDVCFYMECWMKS